MRLHTPRIYRDPSNDGGSGGGGEGDPPASAATVALKPGQIVVDASEYQRAQRQAVERKEALRKIVGEGGSVDDVLAKLSELDEIKTKQAEEEGKYQELLAKEREARAAAEAKASETAAAWEREKLHNAVTRAAVKAGAVDPAQIVAIFGGAAKIEDGKLVVAESGADFEEFLAEQAKGSAANLFKAQGKPGSGAAPGDGAVTDSPFKNLPPEQRARIESLKASGVL